MSAHESLLVEPFSYRFYARLTPGDERPSVWCGDIAGPNVALWRRHRSMVAARLHAWWLNRRRGK